MNKQKSDFSEFFHKASKKQKEKLFKKVVKQANQDQKKLVTKSKSLKYNWPELKNEYLLGETDNLLDFLKDRLGSKKGFKLSGFIRDSTAGWREDRNNFIKEQAKKALEMAQEKMSKNMAIALNNCRSAVMAHFKDTKKSERLSPKDLKILWSIIRTESNLPTIIQKQEGGNNVFLPTVIIQKDYGSKPIEVDTEAD